MDTKLKKVGEKLIQSYVKMNYPNAVCNSCGNECQVTRVFVPTKTIVKEGYDYSVYMEFEELDGSPCCESEVTLYNDLGEEHPNPYFYPDSIDLDNEERQIKYEKLELDSWNILELVELFENGELYRKVYGQFYQVKSLSELNFLVEVKREFYKRTEYQVALERDIGELYDEEISFHIPIRENGKIIIFSNNRHVKYSMEVGFNTIHKLSETLKRHGK